MKLISILESMLIVEYSDGLIRKLVHKFKLENPELTDEIITTYINDFKNISTKLENKDITKYSWKELETTVDANRSTKIKAGKIDVTVPDSNLLYNKDGIRLYHANSKKACVKYSNGYSFCIGARGSGNLYHSYRYSGTLRGGTTKYGTPYFIFNDNLSKEDKTHVLVIFVNVKIDLEKERTISYSLTTALNDGDKRFESMNSIVRLYPWVKPLVPYIKDVEIAGSEKEYYETRRRLDLEFNNKKDQIYKPYNGLRDIGRMVDIIIHRDMVGLKNYSPVQILDMVSDGCNYYQTFVNLFRDYVHKDIFKYINSVHNKPGSRFKKKLVKLPQEFYDCFRTKVNETINYRYGFLSKPEEMKMNLKKNYGDKLTEIFKDCYISKSGMNDWDEISETVGIAFNKYINNNLSTTEFDDTRKSLSLKPEIITDLKPKLVELESLIKQMDGLEKKFGII